MLTKTDALGNVTTYAPDDNGNVTEVSEEEVIPGSSSSGTYVTDFAYDALNRRTSRTVIDRTSSTNTKVTLWGRDTDSTVDTTYDSLSRVLTEAQTYGSNTKTTTYTTWNAEGGLEQLDYAGGFSAHRTYDDVDRLTQITDGTNTVAAFDLYGAGGRIKKTTYGNTTHADYAYDGFRRPTEIHHKTYGNTQFAGFDYDWDKNDNPLYEKRSHRLTRQSCRPFDAIGETSDRVRLHMEHGNRPSPLVG